MEHLKSEVVGDSCSSFCCGLHARAGLHGVQRKGLEDSCLQKIEGETKGRKLFSHRVGQNQDLQSVQSVEA